MVLLGIVGRLVVDGMGKYVGEGGNEGFIEPAEGSQSRYPAVHLERISTTFWQ